MTRSAASARSTGKVSHRSHPRRPVHVHRHEPLPGEARLGAEFEAVWLKREVYLDAAPGFIEFHLLRGPKNEDHTLYSSHTVWRSRADFEAWTRSEAFRAAHKGAGGNKPLYLGHPQFEGFEVLQTVAARRQ
jgi:heme-degrading monooxygenase HmoA